MLRDDGYERKVVQMTRQEHTRSFNEKRSSNAVSTTVLFLSRTIIVSS